MPSLVKTSFFTCFFIKKTPHNLTYPPFSPVFMRLPDRDLFSREVTIKVTIKVTTEVTV